MAEFSIRVLDSNGDPREGVGVQIYYDINFTGDKKRTDEDGWVTFTNYDHRPGEIWVDGEDMGHHSLSDGRTYSFTV